MARISGKARRIAVALFAAAAITVAAGPADALPDICRTLETQLAAASSPAKSPQYRAYEQAIDKQQAELDKAQAQAARFGCGSFVTSANAGTCGALNATISGMRRNLLSLRSTLRQLAAAAGSDRRRADLLADLETKGCRGGQTVEARAVPTPLDGSVGRPVPFEKLYGPELRHDDPGAGFEIINSDPAEPAPAPIQNDEDAHTVVAPSGPLQTMCVRTCDGYYFPISSQATTADLTHDEQSCQSLCPGTQVDLFYRPLDNADSAETMVSASTGGRYGDLLNAFLYRRPDFKRPAQCGCNPSRSFSIIGGEAPLDDEFRTTPMTNAPTPLTRPDSGADPETLANQAGRLDQGSIITLLKPQPAQAHATTSDGSTGSTVASAGNATADDRKRIRVVGPTFLPDPQEAIDLRAPGQTPAR